MCKIHYIFLYVHSVLYLQIASLYFLSRFGYITFAQSFYALPLLYDQKQRNCKELKNVGKTAKTAVAAAAAAA